MKDKILLIDFANQVWRSTIGFGKQPEMSQNTIVFNFYRNLRPIVEMFSPNKIFFVLEGHPQFRYDLYSEYKANRITKTASKKETVDSIYEAKKIILEIAKHFPVAIAKADNYECDDIIYSLCLLMQDEDLTILSNDSDYIQLLQLNIENIKIYNPIKKCFMEAPAFPYVVWKSLAGDKSDNIKSLVSANKAEDLCLNPEKLSSFLDVEENRANFSINHQLIKFAEVPHEEIIIESGNFNAEEIKKSFINLEFNSLIKDKTWEKFIKTFNCVTI